MNKKFSVRSYKSCVSYETFYKKKKLVIEWVAWRDVTLDIETTDGELPRFKVEKNDDGNLYVNLSEIENNNIVTTDDGDSFNWSDSTGEGFDFVNISEKEQAKIEAAIEYANENTCDSLPEILGELGYNEADRDFHAFGELDVTDENDKNYVFNIDKGEYTQQ